MRRVVSSGILFAALLTAPLGAQRVRLEVTPPGPATQEGPAITTSNLLADPGTRDPLVNGAFPTGIHYRLELWRKGGVVDDFDGRSEWDVLVSYDPTRQVYNVIRKQDNNVIENFGAFSTLEAAEAQFGRTFRVSLRPARAGRYYYNLIVEVKTLTESDLDALQQWMRGPNGGSSNPLSFIGRGLRKLLSRVLGGAKRHYEQQSGEFAYP
ncbi:MAG TPA: hypothetical protein VIP11_13585 [Gemmatimonadaceae bacterium]